MSEASIFEQIRGACAEVARRARSVRIDDEALERFAALLARERPPVPTLDPAQRPFADADTTVAFVLTINAINFGSGWFPELRKRHGLSGYLSIATALREHFEKSGAPSAGTLQGLRRQDCAAIFGQPDSGPAGELMGLYAEALRELGGFLARRFRSRFRAPIEEAGGSAARLVAILTEMPFYRDVSTYDGFSVPFYKRAQITAADLHGAFGGRGLGAFRDLDELTLFADNLVPHTLRMLQVLRFDLLLERRIDSGELLPQGSEPEVEIRAVALHAVEQIVRACRRRGWKVNAQRIDHLLWTRGQSPEIKARPRHRTRCTFY